VCYCNGNVRFENFVHVEWSEEKFLKGVVGDKRRLSFWNKNKKIELLFTQLAHYNRMHERVLKYQKIIPEKLANKSNLSRHNFDIKFVLSACIYSSPAACAKYLSFEACFRSIAWFGDLHYLSRTSPHSIHCAWNSRIFRKTLLPLRNLWNFAPCKRFRPVESLSPNLQARFCKLYLADLSVAIV